MHLQPKNVCHIDSCEEIYCRHPVQLLKPVSVDPKFQFPMAAYVYVWAHVKVYSIALLFFVNNDMIAYTLSALQSSIYTFTEYSSCCFSQQAEIGALKQEQGDYSPFWVKSFKKLCMQVQCSGSDKSKSSLYLFVPLHLKSACFIFNFSCSTIILTQMYNKKFKSTNQFI